MALERDFITPAGAVIQTTANVVGNTASLDMISNTDRSSQRPSLLLDFVKTRSLDPRVTMRRASTATYTDPKGIIQSAAINEPRFDYTNGVCQGLLLEEQRTNFFAPLNITSYSVVPGVSIGPDNRLAHRWVLPAGARIQYPTVGRAPSPHTFSIAQGSTIDFMFTGFFGPCYGQTEPLIVIECNTNNSSNYIYATYQINGNTGTTLGYGSNPEFTSPDGISITRHINGMWKVSFRIRYTQSATLRNTMICYIQPRDTVSSNGDYTLGAIEGGFEYACCQAEVGSQATSYIPTGNATATRLADIAYIEGTNFSDWYNARNGSLYVEARQIANTYNVGVAFIGSNELTGNNCIHHTFINTNPSIGNEVFANGAGISQNFTGYTFGSIFKVASTVSGNFSYNYTYTFHYNGTLIGSGPITAIPTNVDRLVFGSSRFTNGAYSSGSFNGYMRKVAFYKTALTNAQMQTLTQ